MRLIRFALLTVITLVALSLVIAVARPETGPAEKALLAVLFVVLVLASRPVQRIGTSETQYQSRAR